jgi:hypothetical protein
LCPKNKLKELWRWEVPKYLDRVERECQISVCNLIKNISYSRVKPQLMDIEVANERNSKINDRDIPLLNDLVLHALVQN